MQILGLGLGSGGGDLWIYACNLGGLWLEDPLEFHVCLKSQSISIFTCMVPSCAWDLIKAAKFVSKGKQTAFFSYV